MVNFKYHSKNVGGCPPLQNMYCKYYYYIYIYGPPQAGLPIVLMIVPPVSVVSTITFHSPNLRNKNWQIFEVKTVSGQPVRVHGLWQYTGGINQPSCISYIDLYLLMAWTCVNRLFKPLYLMVCRLNSMKTLLVWNYALYLEYNFTITIPIIYPGYSWIIASRQPAVNHPAAHLRPAFTSFEVWDTQTFHHGMVLRSSNMASYG